MYSTFFFSKSTSLLLKNTNFSSKNSVKQLNLKKKSNNNNNFGQEAINL